MFITQGYTIKSHWYVWYACVPGLWLFMFKKELMKEPRIVIKHDIYDSRYDTMNGIFAFEGEMEILLSLDV